MFGDIEMDYLPPVMGQHDEIEPYSECRRGHDKEVDCDEVFYVLVEKCPPSRKG